MALAVQQSRVRPPALVNALCHFVTCNHQA